MQATVTITVFERSAPYDEIDFTDGGGMPDDIEPYEVEALTVPDDADVIQEALDELGLSEWDGGSVGYRPDGYEGPAFDSAGTMTERWAVIGREVTR